MQNVSFVTTGGTKRFCWQDCSTRPFWRSEDQI